MPSSDLVRRHRGNAEPAPLLLRPWFLLQPPGPRLPSWPSKGQGLLPVFVQDLNLNEGGVSVRKLGRGLGKVMALLVTLIFWLSLPAPSSSSSDEPASLAAWQPPCPDSESAVRFAMLPTCPTGAGVRPVWEFRRRPEQRPHRQQPPGGGRPRGLWEFLESEPAVR